LLSTTHKIVSHILISRLSPYVDEIIGHHQCLFRRNRLTIDQIFCFREILEKKWEYNDTVNQLFTDLEKAYESVRKEVLYNIRMKFRVPMKIVRLIKIYLNETYSKGRLR
jgi:hypothetical protein